MRNSDQKTESIEEQVRLSVFNTLTCKISIFTELSDLRFSNFKNGFEFLVNESPLTNTHFRNELSMI